MIVLSTIYDRCTIQYTKKYWKYNPKFLQFVLVAVKYFAIRQNYAMPHLNSSLNSHLVSLQTDAVEWLGIRNHSSQMQSRFISFSSYARKIAVKYRMLILEVGWNVITSLTNHLGYKEPWFQVLWKSIKYVLKGVLDCFDLNLRSCCEGKQRMKP